MADNVLRGTISVTAPGVKETFAQVATGAKQAETGLKNLGTGVSKSVGDLEAQIKRLQAGFRDGLNVESFNRLNRAVDIAKARITSLNAIGNPLKNLTTGSNQASFALLNMGRVIQDAPFGIIGITNNLNPLIESLQRASAAAKLAGTSLGGELLRSLKGAGGLGFAVSVASTALLLFTNGFQSFSRKTKQAKEDVDKFKEAVDGIFSSVAKEAAEVGSLIALLNNETETRGRKLAAIKELQKIQPEVFNGLKLEGDAVVGLDAIYKNYLENLKLVIAAKIKQAQLENLIEKLLRAQGVALTSSEKQFLDAGAAITKFASESAEGTTLFGKGQQKIRDESAKTQKQIESDINSLLKDLSELSKGIKIKIDTPNVSSEIDKIIAKGKRLAAEFGDTSKINLSILPTFSEVDTKAEQLKKAQQIIRDVNAFFKDFSSKNRALKLVIPLQPEPLVLPPEQAVITRTQAEITNILKGIADFKPEPVDVKFDFTLDFAKKVDDLKTKLKELTFSKFGITLDDSTLDPALQKIIDIQRATEATADALINTLTPAFQDLFSSIAEGGDGLRSFFDALKNQVKQLISQLIAAAVAAAILAALIPGSIGFLKIFGKLLGFERGGRPPVGKPSVVGEGGHEIFQPDVGRPILIGAGGPQLFKPDRGGTIIPHNKVKEFSYSVSTSDSVKDISHTISKIVSTVLDKVVQFQSTTLDKVAEFHSNVSSSFEKIIGYTRVERSRDTSKSSKDTVSLSKDVSRLFEKALVSTDSSHSSISTKDISKILSEALVYSHSSSAQKELVSKYNVSDVAKILSTVFTSTSTHDRDSSKATVNTFDKVIHSAFQYSTSATDKLIDRLATYTDKSSKSSDSKVFQSLISSKELSQLLSTYTTASRSSELFSDVSRSVNELYSLFTNFSDSKLISTADKSTTATESRSYGSTLVTDKLLSTYSDLAAYYSDSKLVSTQTTATFKSILNTLREFSQIAGSVIKTTSAINTTSVATATNTTRETTATATRESSHSSATDHKTSIRESIVSFIQSSKQIFYSVNNTIERLLSTVIKTQTVQPALVRSGDHLTNITRAASTLNNLTRNVQFRAAGGPVSRNAPTIVGESGPELFTPKVSGYIIPHHKVNSYLKNLYKTSIAEKEINLFRSTRNVKDLNLSKIFNRRISNFSQLTHKELSTIIGKQFAGFRAGGGFVGGGRSIVVGERQLELFVPNTGASIINNNNNTGSVGRVSGGTLKVEGNIRIAGSDLIAVIANASRSQSRLS